MTTVRRLVSGNIAGMATMIANLGVQVAVVPIFLGAWGAAGLATWLALTTAIALAVLLDTAHLDYLGFEAMKLPVGDSAGRSHILSDALPVIAVVGLVELGIVAAIVWSPWAARVFGVAPGSHELGVVRYAMLAMFAVWLVAQAPVGLLGRGLSSMGHFSTTVWWYLLVNTSQAVAPALVALAGGGLATAVAAYLAVTVAAMLVNGWYYLRLARRGGVGWVHPDVRAGARRLLGGLTLGTANVVEYFQQAGFRLILLPFLGAARLVSFSTLRTVANVVQQGLLILVNPMLPELMRFVSERDRHRIALMMSAMLYLTVLALCPGLVLLQAIVRPVYAAWTLGKLPFDALTFTMLSTALLLSAWSQASRAVVRGNNLVRAQTAISVATGVVLLSVTFLTAPRLGLRGAALGVVAAELLRAAAFFVLGVRWFAREKLAYPSRATAAAAIVVGVTTATVFAIALRPEAVLPVLAVYAGLWIASNLLFWRALSSGERDMIAGSVERLRSRLPLAAAR